MIIQYSFLYHNSEEQCTSNITFYINKGPGKSSILCEVRIKVMERRTILTGICIHLWYYKKKLTQYMIQMRFTWS